MPNEFFNAVIGVFINQNNQVLIGQRQLHQVYAGYWEFPGGKVEPNEDYDTALKREMHEELGIVVNEARCFVCAAFQYPTRLVHLHTYLITAFEGVIKGNEGQLVEWVTITELLQRKHLEANQPILAALADTIL